MIQPLKINKKVDNDAKLAQIIKENIPASEFMSADEVNSMVGKINEMVPAINVSNGGFQGVLEINEKRVDSGFYIPTESGTFINAGNVVVDLSQGINFVTYDGDKWDVAVVPLSLNLYSFRNIGVPVYFKNEIIESDIIWNDGSSGRVYYSDWNEKEKTFTSFRATVIEKNKEVLQPKVEFDNNGIIINYPNFVINDIIK
ncbi:hypothetical protein HXZ91_04995 [Myroides odoratimimus]|uniref:hypothetical protein n=1 Tax=Myroides odoratimimus TaxID=76832 RepID=UPI0025783003|nr:hypothetical protein [Myroides odoratimimus]MDM1033836.1 hypothetical protein [Myroides odoratimimus]